MLSSTTPEIVEKDGKLFLIAGTTGSSAFQTSVMQLKINVSDPDAADKWGYNCTCRY